MNIYDKSYYERYVKQAKSELGKKIYKARWELIKKYVDEGKLLDYGCGPGAFNAACPGGFELHGFDINPSCGFSKIDHWERWNIVTFWDSLEHIPDFYRELKRLSPKWLFITCPNLEAVKGDIKDWRHYRPGEHLFYFDKYSLEVILESLRYKIIDHNFDEGKLRNPNNPDWIMTVVAKRDWE